MVPICDDVHVEPGTTPEEIASLKVAYETGMAAVERALGPGLRSSPLTLFCKTADCKIALGAPRSAAASKDLGFARDVVLTKDGPIEHSAVVVSSPVATTHRILTHEMVHAEMKAWVPYDALPTWFNEGVATFVAGEPDCSSTSCTRFRTARDLEWDYVRGVLTHSVNTALRSSPGGTSPCASTKSWKRARSNRGPMAARTSSRSSTSCVYPKKYDGACAGHQNV